MRLVHACLVFVFLFLLAPTAQAADIERIEPANWWIGMQHNRVELLVHGKGLSLIHI